MAASALNLLFYKVLLMENMKISRIFYEKKLFVKVEMSLFA